VSNKRRNWRSGHYSGAGILNRKKGSKRKTISVVQGGRGKKKGEDRRRSVVTERESSLAG